MHHRWSAFRLLTLPLLLPLSLTAFAPPLMAVDEMADGRTHESAPEHANSLATLVEHDFASASPIGYYRHPAIHGETIIFTAEGDLWRVGVAGGVAQRLTTHPGEEAFAAISPDGRTIAFVGHYEGPGEVYTMPIDGGVPVRRTWDGAAARNQVVGWTPDGRVLYSTRRYSGLPNAQLVVLDIGALDDMVASVSPGGARGAGTLARGAGSASTAPSTAAGTNTTAVSTAAAHTSSPTAQLAVKASATGQRRILLPLAQAADGAYDHTGRTLYFTRQPFQGSHARRYQGGTAQQLWRFDGAGEATPLTADYPGTSKEPMPWNGRVYFVSDRDGVMNIWSMPEGDGAERAGVASGVAASGVAAGATAAISDLRQHTFHKDYEIRSPSLHDGRIVYQHGADLRLLDLRGDPLRGQDRALEVRLASDFDHMRETWIERPMEWVTSAHPSPDGNRVVLTARGQVFVAPVGAGRRVEATRASGVRYRDARFLPDGRNLLALSDESGEVELWTMPANGIGERRRLTKGATILRWAAVPSPDGRWIAHHDKDQRLWLHDLARGTDREIARSDMHFWLGGTGVPFSELAWSPDGRWLAYTTLASNQIGVIELYDTETGATVPLTTDRYDSWSPAWSPDGEWLYFLSDRNFRSLVGSPWGTRQPQPFFDKQTKVYGISLRDGARARFAEPDEVAGEQGAAARSAGAAGTTSAAAASSRAQGSAAAAGSGANGAARAPGPRVNAAAGAPPRVVIDTAGLNRRLYELPLAPGNYDALWTDDARLYFLERPTGGGGATLRTLALAHDAKPETFMENVRSYEPTADGKGLLVRRGDELLVLPAGARAPGELAKHRVHLSDWRFAYDPREEWRQMYTEAWRLHRDYLYDPGMHGLDWPAIHAKYLPLAERVTDRAELADVLGQMIAELSLLHASVSPGDVRRGSDQVEPASLGAVLTRDEAGGGWRISHIYRADPDRPDRLSPLDRPGVGVRVGDVILAIDGVPTLSVADPGELLRDKAGRQVLLSVRPGGGRGGGGIVVSAGTSGRGRTANTSRNGTGDRAAGRTGTAAGMGAGAGARDIVVTPITQGAEAELRYDEWEYTRRLAVDSLSGGRIGYVHLRAMGGANMAEWAHQYYPVYDRDALIVDVRHNRGGNIDSWILERLMRRAWMYWQPRVGKPYWNMQFAFRGPMATLVNEWTASDGEAFAEGFRRLGLGQVIGTRTWGGEVWLSANNFLVDRGIATAAEAGVYGPEGEWLIEGWGVDPDIVIDNLPHATFHGSDAQLEAAVRHLLEELEKRPVETPPAPRYPGGGEQ